MADGANIRFGAFRHVDLTTRWWEMIAIGDQARVTQRHERHLKAALQLPMYKNLPTSGFKYDWKKFRNPDGLFVVRIRGPADSNHINNHVKHLSPEQMDKFCADVFDEATQHLDDFSSPNVEDFWIEIFEELGIQVQPGSVGRRAFWDWAMKIVAARIAFGQLEESSNQELHGLTASDSTGDIKMSDQPSNNSSDPKPLSLAAQAVDKFLALGVSKYDDVPRKVKAITRHHEFIAPGKRGPDKPSTKASINQPKILKETPTPQRIPDEPQSHAMAAQDLNAKADALDDLTVGLHDTTIEGATKGPQFLTNLAVRTVHPLKRHYDDTEETGGLGEDDRPPVKFARFSKAHSETSSFPSQLGQP